MTKLHTLLLTGSLQATAAQPGEMRVRVTGEMWWWRVTYLGEGGEPVIRDANELHVPVGQPVLLEHPVTMEPLAQQVLQALPGSPGGETGTAELPMIKMI